MARHAWITAGLLLVPQTLPAHAATPLAWSEWTNRAISILQADRYGELNQETAEPQALKAACAESRRPIVGGADLPLWTAALPTYCRVVYLMKTWSEFPVPMWRRVCRDARQAVAMLEQARPVAEEPRMALTARRLVEQWREEYAASCPVIIPPPGYPA